MTTPDMTTQEKMKYHSPRMKQPRMLNMTSLCRKRFCCIRQNKTKVIKTRTMVHVDVATMILWIMRLVDCELYRFSVGASTRVAGMRDWTRKS